MNQTLFNASRTQPAPAQKHPADAACQIDNPVQAYGPAPQGVVRPRNVEELQAIVRASAEQRQGLVPVSSAGVHSKTGICCREPHVQVDLSGWKDIPFASRRNRVVQVAAGVTYSQALDVLAPLGLTLPMPLAPRSGKSILAACCERAPITWGNKQWETADPMACMEFVFGTGDLFRTGAAGGPGTLERQRAVGQAQKAPLGPGATDFHRLIQGAQGSFGIASWITVRAELKPSIERPWLIGCESLARLSAFVYEVQRVKWGEESFILNRSAAAQLISAQEGRAFDGLYDSLPEWICLQNIAGFERLPAQRLACQRSDIARVAARYSLQLSERLGNVSAERLLLAARTPCGETDWRHALAGNALSVCFQTTLDRSEALIRLALQTSAQQAGVAPEFMPALRPAHGGVYVQPIVQNRACEVELWFPYAPADQQQREAMMALERALYGALNEAHAFFSRPYGYAELKVFENNPLNTRFLHKLKNIFDPQCILNPGKFGFQGDCR